MFNKLCDKLKKLTPENFYISLGFDGYLDEIIKAVDCREDISNFTNIKTITQLGDRILSAAGKSTNIELVTDQWKLGGNGPILGNSIAKLGASVDYIGALGLPEIHEVFKNLPSNFKSTTIDNPGHTMALEFDDGKIMLGRLAMKNLNWESLEKNTTKEHLVKFFYGSNLLGMVNWTQTPHMTQIWDMLLKSYLPKLPIPKVKPFLFIDLADPQKRELKDILYMLDQLKEFAKYFKVILGLNEKESYEIADIQKIKHSYDTKEALQDLSMQIKNYNNLYCCVIHPVKFAICSIEDNTYYHEGPFTPNPLISTGAGDHFNAGFCFGQIAELSPEESLLIGVANSGFYVRTAKSANLKELTGFIYEWKNS